MVVGRVEIKVALILLLCCFCAVQAVELNQTLFQEQSAASRQAQRSHGKFIDDWDEEKQEYRTEADKKEEEAEVVKTTTTLEKNEARTEELSEYQDPTEVKPSDYYKYKRSQVAQDLEKEKEREKAQKAQPEKTAQGADAGDTSLKALSEELDQSGDPSKPIFSHKDQEDVDEIKNQQASVFDYMDIIKQNAMNLKHKIEEEDKAVSSASANDSQSAESTAQNDKAGSEESHQSVDLDSKSNKSSSTSPTQSNKTSEQQGSSNTSGQGTDSSAVTVDIKIQSSQIKKEEEEQKQQFDLSMAKSLILEEKDKIQEQEKAKEQKKLDDTKKQYEQKQSELDKALSDEKKMLDHLEKKIALAKPKINDKPQNEPQKSQNPNDVVAQQKLNRVDSWLNKNSLSAKNESQFPQKASNEEVMREKLSIDDKKDEQFLKDQEKAKMEKAMKAKSIEPLLSQNVISSNATKDNKEAQKVNQTHDETKQSEGKAQAKKEDKVAAPAQPAASNQKKENEGKQKQDQPQSEQKKPVETKPDVQKVNEVKKEVKKQDEKENKQPQQPAGHAEQANKDKNSTNKQQQVPVPSPGKSPKDLLLARALTGVHLKDGAQHPPMEVKEVKQEKHVQVQKDNQVNKKDSKKQETQASTPVIQPQQKENKIESKEQKQIEKPKKTEEKKVEVPQAKQTVVKNVKEIQPKVEDHSSNSSVDSKAKKEKKNSNIQSKVSPTVQTTNPVIQVPNKQFNKLDKSKENLKQSNTTDNAQKLPAKPKEELLKSRAEEPKGGQPQGKNATPPATKPESKDIPQLPMNLMNLVQHDEQRDEEIKPSQIRKGVTYLQDKVQSTAEKIAQRKETITNAVLSSSPPQSHDEKNIKQPTKTVVQEEQPKGSPIKRLIMNAGRFISFLFG